MRKLLAACCFVLFAYITPVYAQSFSLVIVPNGCGTANYQSSLSYLTIDSTGKLCVNATVSASISGTTSNASSAVATSSTNLPTVSYTYGFNGTTWDQLQVDGSKNLKVNCASGCAGGTASNATSGVATSSTNGQSVSWLYGFNGTTWDQLQVDGSKNLKVTGPVTLASLPLPSGAATSANQSTEITSLGTIATNSGTQATAANQATGNTSLATIATNSGLAIPAGTNTIGNVGADPSSGKGTPASVAINISSSTTTQLVALSGSTKIYVTSYDVIAGGTGNIGFEYGTGSNCGTGTTALTGVYNLTAQAGIAKGNGLGAILVVPAGNALCAVTSASVQMSGSVSFQQF